MRHDESMVRADPSASPAAAVAVAAPESKGQPARILAFLLVPVILGGILFVSAGDWHLPAMWLYLGLWCIFGVLFRLTIDRELQRERLSRGTKGEGQYFRALLGPFALAHLVVAGLDVGRFHWSDVPLLVQIGGFVGFALGLALVWWSLYVNRFFAPAILVQQEKGHQVISTGPYGIVRHPGYLGMAVVIAGSGLALGSYWSLVPGLGYVALLVLRTAREDRVLREQLPGYAEYAGRVRFRLLPGVW
jgi:protein-S-isoprenylcysteine O-methyltransferase Ste14